MTNLWSSSAALWLLSECLIILALASKSSQYRWVYFSLIFSLNYYQVFHSTISFGNIVADYGLGCRLVAGVLFASQYTLLADGNRELRVIGAKSNISLAPFRSRVWWAASLLYNPRGIGWAHQPTPHLPPPPKHKTRSAFIVSQVFWIAVYVILYDANMTLMRANPYFMKDGIITSRYDCLWRLGGVCYLVMLYFVLSIEPMILSVIWVGTGISEPRDWPPLVGSVADAYTLRRFWGRTWHQMFRGIFTSHADFLAKAIGLPLKSKFTTYFKLFAVFFMSGLIHPVGDYVIMHNWVMPHALQCFLLQAVAITLEDGILALARRAGLPSSWFTRIIGYLWVILWFAFSIPFWMDPEVPFGFFDQQAYPGITAGIWSAVSN
ncbi:membrane bound O-acyl transferase family-domain-containing protein [Flammula alnicola]|nr:membrane bound O-acyl transferase family-domain-containing protein [Flammula alnicola]